MGYDLWTEFYATYSTYKYNEQVALYDSFEQVFNNEQMNDDKKMYYTSRILGYYLSEGHSSRCDKLVEKFLRRDKMLKAVGCAKRMFEEHPCISVDEVITYGKLIKESCTYSGSVRDFRPLSHDELWELFKRK